MYKNKLLIKNLNVMKKITIFLSLVLFASLVIGQVNVNYKLDNTKEEKTKTIKQTKEDPVWECTFDEATPLWTVGHDEGTTDWTIDDTTSSTLTFTNGTDFNDEDLPVGTVVTALWIYMGHRDVGEYSESGGNFGWFDLVTDVVNGNESAHNAWIQFDNIDLSACNTPKLSFYQNYKALNSDNTYVDYSVDGGTTWTSIQVNDNVEGNEYGSSMLEVLLPTNIGGESNVSLRFRIQCDGSPVNGYGWEIDDIKIVETPAVDMKLNKSIANFFVYEDYTDPANAKYFHYSSYFGNVPEEVFANESAIMVFNAIVENKGSNEITPNINVKILDDDETEIYNKSVASMALQIGEIDTVDILDEFSFGGEAPERGRYTIIYNIEAESDSNIEDNSDTAYFFVTDNVYSRDADNILGSTGPSVWQSGGNDGDMIGTNYYFFEEDEITSISAYIANGTTVGTYFVLHLMSAPATAGEDWDDIITSTVVTVTEDMLGDWYTFEFPTPALITPEEGTIATVKVALEIQNMTSDANFYVGYDPTVTASAWGTNWYFTQGQNPNEWIAITNWSSGGVALRLETLGDGGNVNNTTSEMVNIYPNPSTGILNISGIEGANIEILNLMGQVVETLEDIDENTTVDMSKYTNGTYIVKAILNGKVITRKIDIIK